MSFCRGERLIRGELVAIDGSKFLAVASKRRVVSRKKLERQVVALDADIARYLAKLETADATESSEAVPDLRALRETLVRLKDKRDDVATAAALMTEMGVDHHVQGEAAAYLSASLATPASCSEAWGGGSGEMALAGLAYNFKRVTNILGIPALLARLAPA